MRKLNLNFLSCFTTTFHHFVTSGKRIFLANLWQFFFWSAQGVSLSVKLKGIIFFKRKLHNFFLKFKQIEKQMQKHGTLKCDDLVSGQVKLKRSSQHQFQPNKTTCVRLKRIIFHRKETAEFFGAQKGQSKKHGTLQRFFFFANQPDKRLCKVCTATS